MCAKENRANEPYMQIWMPPQLNQLRWNHFIISTLFAHTNKLGDTRATAKQTQTASLQWAHVFVHIKPVNFFVVHCTQVGFPIIRLCVCFHRLHSHTVIILMEKHTPLTICHLLGLHSIPPQVNQSSATAQLYLWGAYEHHANQTKPNQTKWNVCSTYLINFKLIFAMLRPRTSQPHNLNWPLESRCVCNFISYLLMKLVFHIPHRLNFSKPKLFHLDSPGIFFFLYPAGEFKSKCDE